MDFSIFGTVGLRMWDIPFDLYCPSFLGWCGNQNSAIFFTCLSEKCILVISWKPLCRGQNVLHMYSKKNSPFNFIVWDFLCLYCGSILLAVLWGILLLQGPPVEELKITTISSYKKCQTFFFIIVYLGVNIFVTLGHQHICAWHSTSALWLFSESC